MKSLSDLRVKIFADGADKAGMLELHRQPYIKGFTTNPTLMRGIGVTDYQGFALDLLAHIQDRPMAFEVFADDEEEMEESGPAHRGLGQKRVCQSSGDEHKWLANLRSRPLSFRPRASS